MNNSSSYFKKLDEWLFIFPISFPDRKEETTLLKFIDI